jgi:uncharacterized membrane protein
VTDGVRSLVAQLADVWAVLALLAVGNVVLLLLPTPVRLVLAAVFLFLLPGYALTTLAFPARSGRRATNPFKPDLNDGVLGEGERAALSLGLSFALVPLFGIAMAFAEVPLTLENALLAVTAFVLLVLGGGTVRRLRTPTDSRYKAPFFYWLGEGARSFRGTKVDIVLNVALAVVLVAAMSTFAVALTAPQNGTTYTEASLLTETPDGELVSGNYPTEFGPEGQADLVLRLSNHEGEAVVYTVVVQIQRLEADTEGPREVTARSELFRESQRVADGETWDHEHTVTPTFFGDDLRVVYLVYAGTPPEEPTTENAYRYLSLSIDVTEPE